MSSSSKPLVYVSAPATPKGVMAANELLGLLDAMGCDTSLCVWSRGKVGYENGPEHLRECAIRDAQAVAKCDIFFQLALPGSKGGMFVELGIAMALDKSIYVIGDPTCVFHYHDAVRIHEGAPDHIQFVRDDQVRCLCGRVHGFDRVRSLDGVRRTPQVAEDGSVSGM